MKLEDIIYQFLLRSGYTRASIVMDGSTFGQLTSGEQPSFYIVDPQSADRLAVISVVGALDGDQLIEEGVHMANVASRLGGKAVQGFVIRVDLNGHTEFEKVQFYKSWPNNDLQQLSAIVFPDLDTLRVAQKLVLSQMAAQPSVVDMDDADEVSAGAQSRPRMGLGAYVPGVLLLVLAILDWVSGQTGRGAFLDTPQTILLVGAAALLTALSVARFNRSSREPLAQDQI